MSAAKPKINQNLDEQIKKIFYGLIADIKSEKEARLILSDLFSETELNNAIDRLSVAIYLDKARSPEQINKQLSIPLETITEVKGKLGNEGLLLSLQKIKSEIWAENWSRKINGFIKKFHSK